MAVKVLVTAASKQGATAEIARVIGDVLGERGLDCEVLAPSEVVSVEQYDAVVLGSAVYTGHWLQPATALVGRCAGSLARRPVGLFSSGRLVTRRASWCRRWGRSGRPSRSAADDPRAREHRMFAGRLERKQMGLAQRAARRLVRGLDGDFRDWGAIKAWAAGIADALQPSTGQPQQTARRS